MSRTMPTLRILTAVALAAYLGAKPPGAAGDESCPAAAPYDVLGPEALEPGRLLALNTLLCQVARDDPATAEVLAEAIREAYAADRLAGQIVTGGSRATIAPDVWMRFDGAEVLAPLYSTNPDAALDLLRRIQAASGRPK